MSNKHLFDYYELKTKLDNHKKQKKEEDELNKKKTEALAFIKSKQAQVAGFTSRLKAIDKTTVELKTILTDHYLLTNQLTNSILKETNHKVYNSLNRLVVARMQHEINEVI